MKQGQTRKLAPKDKRTKASWKKRDEGRKVNQEVYAANLLLAATDADEQTPGYLDDEQALTGGL